MSQLLNHAASSLSGTATQPRSAQQAKRLAGMVFPAASLLSAGVVVWLMIGWQKAIEHMDPRTLALENWAGGTLVILAVGVAFLLALMWNEMPQLRLPLLGIVLTLSALVGVTFWKSLSVLEIQHHAAWFAEEAQIAKLRSQLQVQQDIKMQAEALVQKSKASSNLEGVALWDAIVEKTQKHIVRAQSELQRIEEVRTTLTWGETITKTGGLVRMCLIYAIALGCAVASGRVLADRQSVRSATGTGA